MRECMNIPDPLALDLVGLLSVWREYAHKQADENDFARGYVMGLGVCADQLANALAQYGNMRPTCYQCKKPVEVRDCEWQHADPADAVACGVLTGIFIAGRDA